MNEVSGGAASDQLRGGPAGATGTIFLTASALEDLERELARLHDVKQREIPDRLRHARQFGDDSNNDEYLAIREDELVLDAQLARLEDILSRSSVVEQSEHPDSVTVGSRVVVSEPETGERFEYLVDTAHGGLEPGIVSPLSPVGRALLGRRLHDRISVELPTGRRRVLELCDVRAPGAE